MTAGDKHRVDNGSRRCISRPGCGSVHHANRSWFIPVGSPSEASPQSEPVGVIGRAILCMRCTMNGLNTTSRKDLFGRHGSCLKVSGMFVGEEPYARCQNHDPALDGRAFGRIFGGEARKSCDEDKFPAPWTQQRGDSSASSSRTRCTEESRMLDKSSLPLKPLYALDCAFTL